jgi:hypothetical protein
LCGKANTGNGRGEGRRREYNEMLSTPASQQAPLMLLFFSERWQKKKKSELTGRKPTAVEKKKKTSSPRLLLSSFFFDFLVSPLLYLFSVTTRRPKGTRGACRLSRAVHTSGGFYFPERRDVG